MRAPSYQLLGVEATTEEGVLMSHPNARLTVHGRLVLVERIEAGWSVSGAAREYVASVTHRGCAFTSGADT